MLQRKGHGPAAAAIATEVNRWARENGPPALRARSHLILSDIFENVGDTAACLDHALRALELADDDTPPRTRGNYLLRLADSFGAVGSIDSARQRYHEAQTIFAEIGDAERQISALNNLAESEAESGDMEQAGLVADELRDLAITHGAVLNPVVLETLARVQIGLGHYERAEADIETALEALDRYGDAEASSPADFLLTLAEIHRRQGRLSISQRTLSHCREICSERGLVGVEVEVLREQAELQAAAGQFEEAFATFKLYHERAVRISSSQREAAARTRQALFETAEARQEALRYWRQARTDELTRLPNRRFVDEELPSRLNQVAAGKSLVVAIVDADHFKNVNDTLSHEVGDRAIAELAGVFQAAIAAPNGPATIATDYELRAIYGLEVVGRENADPVSAGAGERPGGILIASDAVAVALRSNSWFAARLGGEEFLVVLPGLDLPAAIDLLERLRLAVERHDWHNLVGDLPITVSIGGTAALPHDTQSVVLARADRCLYAAKRAGRNRVVVDFSIPHQLTA
jgi:GGDEF domain-containing protein